MSMLFIFIFFKQKTAYEMRISDWSSDVCSSDLCQAADMVKMAMGEEHAPDALLLRQRQITDAGTRVDQNLVIQQQAGRPQARADTAAATENLDRKSVV